MCNVYLYFIRVSYKVAPRKQATAKLYKVVSKPITEFRFLRKIKVAY